MAINQEIIDEVVGRVNADQIRTEEACDVMVRNGGLIVGSAVYRMTYELSEQTTHIEGQVTPLVVGPNGENPPMLLRATTRFGVAALSAVMAATHMPTFREHCAPNPSSYGWDVDPSLKGGYRISADVALCEVIRKNFAHRVIGALGIVECTDAIELVNKNPLGDGRYVHPKINEPGNYVLASSRTALAQIPLHGRDFLDLARDGILNPPVSQAQA